MERIEYNEECNWTDILGKKRKITVNRVEKTLDGKYINKIKANIDPSWMQIILLDELNIQIEEQNHLLNEIKDILANLKPSIRK